MEVPALEEVKLITKEFLEKPELWNRRAVKAILRRFNKPMRKVGFCHRLFGHIVDSDYENVIETKGLTAENIAENIGEIVDGCKTFLHHIKNPDYYESSYNSEATSDASCSEKPEDFVAVLVGIAPMLYAGLITLLDASRAGTAMWLYPTQIKPTGELLAVTNSRSYKLR